MSVTRLGAQTVSLRGARIESFACIGGPMEAKGPLREYFDELSEDSFFAQKSWEAAESTMQHRAFSRALEKGNFRAADIDLVFAGDLLNQCISSTFALRDENVPFLGLYGACSTMGEGLLLASLAVASGFARRAAAMTSSHFCTAERQYRMPLPYGSQRTPTAQWTATAAGCSVVTDKGSVRIGAVTSGKIVDAGVRDANNMGAAMAPAAADTLRALFRETKTSPEDYDLIATGDLGALGSELARELLARSGITLGKNYTDCGLLLYDREGQDMHCGASGCGCSASVLNGYLLRGMREGKWKRVLFAPTGALLSPTSSFQGESIPGICHALVLEKED